MNTRTLNRRVGPAVLIAMLLGMVPIVPSPASALDLGCTSNASCAAGTTCQIAWSFLGITYHTCKAPPLCNTDAECVGGTLCLLGTCQVGCRSGGDCASGQCVNSTCTAPARGGGSGTGGGSGISGEGRHCIPPDGSRPNSWATDSHGKPRGRCPQGTTCNSHGFCVRLQP